MSVLSVQRLKYLLLMSACMLGGCQTFGTPAPPTQFLPDRFTIGSKSPALGRLSEWWAQISDHELKTLVARGLSNSLDVKKTAERVAVANHYVRIAGADALPQIGYGGIGQNSGTIPAGGSGSLGTAGLNLSWLLDFNGKIARQRAAAEAGARAAEFDLGYVRLAYLADLITTYIDMSYYKRTVDITEDSIKNAAETVALIHNMKELGTANDLEIAQALVDLSTLRSSVPPLERDRIIAENRIAKLLGEPAGRLHLKGLSRLRPVLSMGLPPGIPADLVRNRPDIQAKEQLLYAAAEQIGVAKADLLPTLALNGTINAALTQGALAATTWTFASSMVGPILDGGRRRAAIDIATGECRIRHIEWKQNVLTAVEDVENLLTSIQRGQRELDYLHESVSTNERSLSLARTAMAGGTGIFLTVLDAQRSLNRSQLALAQSQRQLARLQISLLVAIGAGSAVPEPVDGAQPPDTAAKPVTRLKVAAN